MDNSDLVKIMTAYDSEFRSEKAIYTEIAKNGKRRRITD
jgi:hypothetical protein